MKELVLTPKFKRAYRKFVNRNPKLQKNIKDSLKQLRNDVFSPPLSAHSLRGKLQGIKACSCGYDCRILFSVEIDQKTGQEMILLLDIGTHDEVY